MGRCGDIYRGYKLREDKKPPDLTIRKHCVRWVLWSRSGRKDTSRSLGSRFQVIFSVEEMFCKVLRCTILDGIISPYNFSI